MYFGFLLVTVLVSAAVYGQIQPRFSINAGLGGSLGTGIFGHKAKESNSLFGIGTGLGSILGGGSSHKQKGGGIGVGTHGALGGHLSIGKQNNVHTGPLYDNGGTLNNHASASKEIGSEAEAEAEATNEGSFGGHANPNGHANSNGHAGIGSGFHHNHGGHLQGHSSHKIGINGGFHGGVEHHTDVGAEGNYGVATPVVDSSFCVMTDSGGVNLGREGHGNAFHGGANHNGHKNPQTCVPYHSHVPSHMIKVHNGLNGHGIIVCLNQNVKSGNGNGAKNVPGHSYEESDINLGENVKFGYNKHKNANTGYNNHHGSFNHGNKHPNVDQTVNQEMNAMYNADTKNKQPMYNSQHETNREGSQINEEDGRSTLYNVLPDSNFEENLNLYGVSTPDSEDMGGMGGSANGGKGGSTHGVGSGKIKGGTGGVAKGGVGGNVNAKNHGLLIGNMKAGMGGTALGGDGGYTSGITEGEMIGGDGGAATGGMGGNVNMNHQNYEDIDDITYQRSSSSRKSINPIVQEIIRCPLGTEMTHYKDHVTCENITMEHEEYIGVHYPRRSQEDYLQSLKRTYRRAGPGQCYDRLKIYNSCGRHLTCLDVIITSRLGNKFTENCTAGCFCKDGFIKGPYGGCIPEEFCFNSSYPVPINQRCEKPDMEYRLCGHDKTCFHVWYPESKRTDPCTSGCFCKSGFLKNFQGVCVPNSYCSSPEYLNYNFTFPNTSNNNQLNESVPEEVVGTNGTNYNENSPNYYYGTAYPQRTEPNVINIIYAKRRALDKNNMKTRSNGSKISKKSKGSKASKVAKGSKGSKQKKGFKKSKKSRGRKESKRFE